MKALKIVAVAVALCAIVLAGYSMDANQQILLDDT